RNLLAKLDTRILFGLFLLLGCGIEGTGIVGTAESTLHPAEGRGRRSHQLRYDWRTTRPAASPSSSGTTRSTPGSTTTPGNGTGAPGPSGRSAPPAPRFWHGMAHDSARGVTVLFGGSGGDAETWG